MLKYSGDGHKRVGTCQATIDRADEVLKRLVAQMSEDG
jgi:hypothetical protein